MSKKRTPIEIAKNLLKNSEEHTRLASALVTAIELRELDPEFFGGDGTATVVRFGDGLVDFRHNETGALRSYRIKDLPSTLLEVIQRKACGDTSRINGKLSFRMGQRAIAMELKNREGAE
ncbi:MAG: hypothetical protein CMF69_00915 [Magnetovibrio sp.]|nr:hypothetical protein [Magnetovibrio sp.]|tara:strand:- start:350 stop:709 length:360 start_codon:yes stop_codon:yes gene_type:complete